MKNFSLLIIFAFILNVSSKASEEFFQNAGKFFATYVENGRVDYQLLSENQNELNELLNKIEQFPYQNADANTQKAFLINAYNILAIANVINHYPIESPLKVKGFFNGEKFKVANRDITLDELEKEWLMKDFFDARLHFILVCAAAGCPEIVPYAYRPEKLEEQIQQRTTEVMSDKNFMRINHSKKEIELSEIFNWYEQDFKKESGSIKAFVREYSNLEVPENYSWSNYPYDWSLNKKKANEAVKENAELNSAKTEAGLQLYTSSVLYDKGDFEIQWLNNFYTQNTFFNQENVREPVDRATYLTSFFKLTVGVHPRLNVGVDMIVKSVHQSPDRSESPAKVLRLGNNPSAQTKAAFLGPRIKFIPFQKLSNFSVQSTFYIPMAKDQEGVSSGRPFLDYDKFMWWSQFFFDQRHGSYLNHFFGLDVIGRFGGSSNLENLVQLPVSYIISAFPTKRLTLYGLGQWFPAFMKDAEGNFGMSQYFIQIGLGTKVYVLPNLEMELSFNHFLYGRSSGAGEVVNLGVRYVFWR